MSIVCGNSVCWCRMRNFIMRAPNEFGQSDSIEKPLCSPACVFGLKRFGDLAEDHFGIQLERLPPNSSQIIWLVMFTEIKGNRKTALQAISATNYHFVCVRTKREREREREFKMFFVFRNFNEPHCLDALSVSLLNCDLSGLFSRRKLALNFGEFEVAVWRGLFSSGRRTPYYDSYSDQIRHVPDYHANAVSKSKDALKLRIFHNDIIQFVSCFTRAIRIANT